MSDREFPQIGDVVFYRDESERKGYGSGVLEEIRDGIDRYTPDGMITEDGYTFVIKVGRLQIDTFEYVENGLLTRTCRKGEEENFFFASEEAVLRQIEKEMDAIRVITASQYMDRSLCPIGHLFGDPVERLMDTEKILFGMLCKQFGMLELKGMYQTYGEENCIKFLNDALTFYSRRTPKGWRSFYRVTFDILPETMKEFASYAYEQGTPICYEPLTIHKFLKMCRVAYDAAGISAKYPPNASDLYLYCCERDRSFFGDFGYVADKDWDSPEVFRDFYRFGVYHIEELQFGGMWINLYFGDDGCWTGEFGYSGHTKAARQAILAYTALRRNGYPLRCHDPDRLVQNANILEQENYRSKRK